MAHLEVRPQKNTPWWVWLLLLAVIIAVVIFLTRRSDDSSMDNTDPRDSMANIELDTSDMLATTEPDWSKVDFNTPAS